MEDEGNPVLSKVKLEIGNTEPVAYWMRLQAWHAQGTGNQHIFHTSSEQIVRGTADVTGSKSEIKQESKSRTVPGRHLMEPHHPVLYKVKTEPDSDADEEVPVFFESSEPLETETVRGKSGRIISTIQMGSEIPSAPPESSLLTFSPAVPLSSAVKFSSVSEASRSAQGRVTERRKRRQKTVEHQKKHECDVCSKVLSRADHLKLHMLMHKGEKNHVCDVCNKAFTQARLLKQHKVGHLQEKNHTCSLCNEAFARLSGLKTHKLTHTGEKNHACEVCNKAFSRLNALNAHMLLHRGEKKHICGVCHKAFTGLTS